MRIWLGAVVVAVSLIVVNAFQLHAQSSLTVANSPTFEVASVKPNTSGRSLPFVPGSPGRFTMTNVPVRVLIQNAYQLLQDAQLVGGPSWVASDRFDIVATAAANPPPEQMALMLRALLAERFKLVVHTETRELPIYALVSARRDGRLGPRIRPATVDCSGARGTANGTPAPASQAGDRVSCGMRFSPGKVVAGGMSLAQLADRLAPFANRTVVDRTGLAGRFDLDLEWTPDNWRTAAFPTDARQPTPPEYGGPSLFTAVQEQLGLKLESTRGPVDVLVIDSVSPPTPD